MSEQQTEAQYLVRRLNAMRLGSVGKRVLTELKRLESVNNELLDALKALNHSLDWEDMIHDDQKLAFSGALSAIAKATGETK